MLHLFFDYPINFAISFQDPATITAEGLINLHHDIMFYLIFIIIFVIYFLYETLLFFLYKEDKWTFPIKTQKMKIIINILSNYNLMVKNKIDKFLINNIENHFDFLGILFLIIFTWFFFDFFFIFFLSLFFIFILYIFISKNLLSFVSSFYTWFFINFFLIWKLRKDSFLEYSFFNNRFFINKDNINHHSDLEVIWTLIPTFILCLIAFPSIRLLYAVDEAIFCPLTVKIIGHQWYWSYEYGKPLVFPQNNMSSENNLITFDSYMIPYDNLEKGHIRLLSCDNSLILPIWINIRLLVTSDDVLHSWAVPSLGVKIDAIPGRLNQNFIYIKRPGMFFGQCSEICGTNHGFMPINVNACYPDIYAFWYLHMLNQFIMLNDNPFVNVDYENLSKISDMISFTLNIRHTNNLDMIFNNFKDFELDHFLLNLLFFNDFNGFELNELLIKDLNEFQNNSIELNENQIDENLIALMNLTEFQLNDSTISSMKNIIFESHVK